jgi:type IV secretory pathway TrbD component
MKCNMGKADRTIRIVVGAAIVAAGFYFQSWWGLVGLVFLGTSLMRWCPAYVPFKFSTAGSKEE